MKNNILAKRIIALFSGLVVVYFIGWSLMVQDRVNEIYCQWAKRQEIMIDKKYENRNMISENVQREEE